MTEITVKGPDSATVMEQVMQQLGEDALIVSTSKVDGLIQIVATNDAGYASKKHQKPLLLKPEHRVKAFSSILKNQEMIAQNTNHSPVGEPDAQKALLKKLEADIAALSDMLQQKNKVEQVSFDVQTLLMMAGLTTRAIQKVNFDGCQNNLQLACLNVAKKFVSSHDPDLLNAACFFVHGKKEAGKSVFIQKFQTILGRKHSDASIKIVENVEDIERLKRVGLELQKKASNKSDKQHIYVIELSSNAPVRHLIERFSSIFADLTVQTIEVVAAGHSYEFLDRHLTRNNHQDSHICFSKLDLCDISLPEISVCLENDRRCTFFSGTNLERSGLYYSRVEQVSQHIKNLVQNRVG